MGPSKQKQYLKHYPRSKHRYLLSQKKDDKPTPEVQKRRRLTRNEYSGLNKKDKAKYDSQFPKNRHKFKHKASKRVKGDFAHDARETKRQAGTRRKADMVEVDKQRNVLVDDGAGVINKESVKALGQIKSEHLHQAAANIDNNRDEAHELIDIQLKDKPNLKERGLNALRDMMEGDGLLDGKHDAEEDDERQATDDDGNPLFGEDGKALTEKQKKEQASESDDEDEDEDEEDEPKPKKKKGKKKKKKHDRAHRDGKKHRDGKALLTMIVKGALIVGAVGLIATAAGPLSMVIARGMLDLYSEMRSLSAAAAAELEKDPDERNYDTIDEVITQTVSYLRNMDMNDLHDQSKEMFSAIASGKNVDIYNVTFSAVLPLAGERPKGRVGKNFFGGSFANMQAIADAIDKALKREGVLHEHEYTKSDIDECHLFYCTDSRRTLVALGMNENLGIYHVAFLNW